MIFENLDQLRVLVEKNDLKRLKRSAGGAPKGRASIHRLSEAH